METALASDRYEKTWLEYLSALSKNPKARLTPYLRSNHVYTRGFWRWMSSCGYSVREAKSRRGLLAQESASVVTSGESSTFSSVIVTGEGPSDCSRPDILTGVSLTLPDGTTVSIRRGSAGAVVSFLKLYSGEGLPCSD